MKLLFCKPTYGPSPDPMFDRSHRAAIMHAANRGGVTWVGDLSPDRLGWAAARNGVVKEAVEAADRDGIEGIFWVDDDIRIPVNAITKLVYHGLDFVSGLYFQRQAPFWPVFAQLNKQKSFQFAVRYPEDALLQCDGVGFGCLLTSMNLLRKVSSLRECKENGPFGGDFGKKTYGEDFMFCLRALKVGIKPHVDTSVKCDHLVGPEFSNEALFRRFQGITGGNNAETDRSAPPDGGDLREASVGGEGDLPTRTV